MSLSLFYCQNVCLVCWYFLFFVDLREARICSKLTCMKTSSTLQLTYSFLIQCYVFDNIFRWTIITCFFDITTNSPTAMLSFTYLKIKKYAQQNMPLVYFIFFSEVGGYSLKLIQTVFDFLTDSSSILPRTSFLANNHLAHVTLRKTSRSPVLFWKPGVYTGNGSWGLLSWQLSAVIGLGGCCNLCPWGLWTRTLPEQHSSPQVSCSL